MEGERELIEKSELQTEIEETIRQLLRAMRSNSENHVFDGMVAAATGLSAIAPLWMGCKGKGDTPSTEG